MSFNFPGSPSNGQAFTPVGGGPSYIWDGSAWRLASSGDTPQQILDKIKQVDGIGSGLDADTLDGNHAAFFAPITYVDAPSDNNTYVRSGPSWTSGVVRSSSGFAILTDVGVTNKQFYINPDGSVQPAGPIRVLDGTLQYPSYAFGGDWSSGIRKAGIQDFRFVVGQTDIQKWGYSGVEIYVPVTLGSGSVDGSLTINGNLTTLAGMAFGDIDCAGVITGLGTFRSSGATATIATTGAGTIRFRPNGSGSSTGEVSVSSAGSVAIAGQLNVGASVGQANAIIDIRGYSTGNGIEWGHSNQAGYGCVIGHEPTNGAPFIAFCGENGTTSGTYRTRGLRSTIIRGDNAGGLSIGNVPTAAATDNQAYTAQLTLSAAGSLTCLGTIQAAQNFVSGTTAVLMAPGSAGNCYLRPAGAGSTTGQLMCSSTTFGVFGSAGAARGALALPTGTVSRVTYATSTVTLPVLAGVVMAMITDLRAMGFFS